MSKRVLILHTIVWASVCRSHSFFSLVKFFSTFLVAPQVFTIILSKYSSIEFTLTFRCVDNIYVHVYRPFFFLVHQRVKRRFHSNYNRDFTDDVIYRFTLFTPIFSLVQKMEEKIIILGNVWTTMTNFPQSVSPV